jgi:hypothetical protein
MSFLLSLMFSLQQNRRQGCNRFFLEAGGGGMGGVEREVAQSMYTHESKRKNDKIKGGKKRGQNW